MKSMVVIPWGRYHELSPGGGAFVVRTMEDVTAAIAASRNRLTQVEIVANARQVADAFNDLCEAAWTPNQSAAERSGNASRINEAREILARLPSEFLGPNDIIRAASSL